LLARPVGKLNSAAIVILFSRLKIVRRQAPQQRTSESAQRIEKQQSLSAAGPARDRFKKRWKHPNSSRKLIAASVQPTNYI
jgi:hypothetical protein